MEGHRRTMKTAVLAITAQFDEIYLPEWAEWYHNTGFDDIWIVTNNFELDEKLPDYVKTYRRDGQVQQLPVYNEWMQKHRHEYDWCLVCDIDEFLYMPDKLQDYLEKRKDCACLGMPWVHFGDNGGKFPIDMFGVVERFQKCQGVYNKHVKPLVNLAALRSANSVFFVNPHFCAVSLQNKSGWLPWIGIDGAVGNGPFNQLAGKPIDGTKPFFAHYYTKTIEEWRRRRGPQHMRADCRQYVTEDMFYRFNFNDVECKLLADKQKSWRAE